MATLQRLIDSDLQGSEFAVADYLARPDAGIAYETLFDPIYWSNVARKLKPYGIIRVIPKTDAYFAELLVIEVGPTWARVVEITPKVDLNAAAKKNSVVDTAETYKVKHRGPRKWSVIRISDQKVMAEDLAQEGDAEAWIAARVTKPAVVPPAPTVETKAA